MNIGLGSLWLILRCAMFEFSARYLVAIVAVIVKLGGLGSILRS